MAKWVVLIKGDFEREKRAKEILEQICDELGSGIGEDTARGLQNAEKDSGLDVGDDVEHGGDDSDDSDLHSIELNMGNDSKAYAFENAARDYSKGFSIDKESVGRKSFSEKIHWGSICFNKGTSSSRKRDFAINIQEVSDHFDPDGSIEFFSRARLQDDKDQTQTNRSATDLQDCMSCANSFQRSGLALTLHCGSEEVGENAIAVEVDNLMQEVAGKKSGC
ncbi:hypothetical protein RJT34_10708 [Clitoria ternatea]|uniref:Uncharacterized protein n=1 Tax=Clitoria ternatea TaxID=43366 RepID=A0AAN9JIJ8_CLITE